MAIYELQSDRLEKLPRTSFGQSGIKERQDLQRLLRTQLDVVCPETLILAEEYGGWDESKRRIDLLGLDKEANLVVIELKRTEDGGHMELQAVRYAAMVSTMTFEQAVAARRAFLTNINDETDPEQSILDFLDWEAADDTEFGQAVRIVLVSAEFSKELTTSVLWLNGFDVDIVCVRLRPYQFDGKLLIDVQQVVPLPEAAEYQVQVKEKSQKERKSRKSGQDWTRYDVQIDSVAHKKMYKRRAILLIARTLVEEGISPEEIATLITWHSNRIWWTVDGECTSDHFLHQANLEAARANKTFDARRWFCDDDELVKFDGKTYAFSNQWGVSTAKAMNILTSEFPQYEISVRPSKQEEA